MKISLNWLTDYLPLNIEQEKLLDILTDIGLEVGGTEAWESVPGGMKGIVVGKVTKCEQHPNADKLKVTSVNIGGDEELPIVCGAPNVQLGQTVVVATVGTKLTMDGESFIIKKAKLRGEPSHGMICAEDEIGLGKSHDGIMVLPDHIEAGTPAAEFFKIETDLIIDIDLTPNRIDAASHYGVARDLAARLSFDGILSKANLPDVTHFSIDNHNLNIPVIIENPEACKRYTSCTVSDIVVKESPSWLQHRLKAIGLNPINNIVDITNYVLHETGHPLHAFDADKIVGGKVFVRKLKEGTDFTTLDDVNRKLSEHDLMICNEESPMCIAGVFGGTDSGVTSDTKAVFLESAWFEPVHVRKTARRHGLNTDASFRFERGADPEMTLYALKRAALLMKEIAGAKISSEINDVISEKLTDKEITIKFNYINQLLGEDIPIEDIRFILKSLDFKILSENKDSLLLNAPQYRSDVTRPADVVEEILRIYGYNRVPTAVKLNASINIGHENRKENFIEKLSISLSSRGFHEAMSNSLSNIDYYKTITEEIDKESIVHLANPGSSELSIMRRLMVFSGLEAIERNINHKNPNLRLFEIGKTYQKNGNMDKIHPVKNYSESMHLAMWITGNFDTLRWNQAEKTSDFYHLKMEINHLLEIFGIETDVFKIQETDSILFDLGMEYSFRKNTLLRFGLLSKTAMNSFDIDQDVWYADFDIKALLDILTQPKKQFKALSKYPEVKRDIALLIDQSVSFVDLKNTAFEKERKYLKSVDLFDVYEGKGIEKEKKSYALSFILQDNEKTMQDKQIDAIMQKLKEAFLSDYKAIIR
jgi:phenylalanyl-tRNA synthetase beta chain